MLGFQKNKTLVSYVPKNKAEIDGKSEKPEVFLDYNLTKRRIDNCVKMCAAYSVFPITGCWPLVMFYTVMNIAGINSHVFFFTEQYS